MLLSLVVGVSRVSDVALRCPQPHMEAVKAIAGECLAWGSLVMQ